jgi:indolepyruvate decarboxylase
MADALRVLTELVGDGAAPPDTATTDPRSWLTECDDPLSQAALWEIVADALQAGDLVTAEQGTAFYGLGAHRLPHGVLFFGQPLWASIGYTLPALLGAALGAPHRRPVLLIGDGAAQMTIQELGTLIHRRIPAIVVVVNNAGYTVERAIHGPEKAYNDIAPWRWADLPAALGGAGFAHGIRAATPGDLAAALTEARDRADRLTLIEAVTPPLDVPPLLTAVADAAAQANAA